MLLQTEISEIPPGVLVVQNWGWLSFTLQNIIIFWKYSKFAFQKGITWPGLTTKIFEHFSKFGSQWGVFRPHVQGVSRGQIWKSLLFTEI